MLGVAQEFSAFAVSFLAGYDSHKVFKWLDARVDKLFKILRAENALELTL
jgi:hypothetical protein